MSPKFSLLNMWGLDVLLLSPQQIQRNLQTLLLASLAGMAFGCSRWGCKGSAVSADLTDPHVILLTWWFYVSWRFALRYILWNRYTWNYQPANCPSPPTPATIKYLWHREAELGGNGGYPLEVTPREDEDAIANMWEKTSFPIVSMQNRHRTIGTMIFLQSGWQIPECEENESQRQCVPKNY